MTTELPPVPVTQEEILRRSYENGFENWSVWPIALANSLGIKVYSMEMSGNKSADIQSKIHGESRAYEIHINGLNALVRQRFSIAHEIAHFVLHKKKLDEFGSIDRNGEHSLSREEESAADDLAAAILMPEQLVKKEIPITQPLDEIMLDHLASKFKVSKMVVILRLKALEYMVPYFNLS